MVQMHLCTNSMKRITKRHGEVNIMVEFTIVEAMGTGSDTDREIKTNATNKKK